jgi:hypothetical protein
MKAQKLRDEQQIESEETGVPLMCLQPQEEYWLEVLVEPAENGEAGHA